MGKINNNPYSAAFFTFAHYIYNVQVIFDILEKSGNSLHLKNFMERKELLADLFTDIEGGRLVQVPSTNSPDDLWEDIFACKGEGMIAKRNESTYSPGKKHNDWLKIKNWRTIFGFLTFYDTNNDYFTVNVYDHDTIREIGKCKHGLDDEAQKTLQQLFITKGEKQANGYVLPPAICASIHTLDLFKDELREPEFKALELEISAEDCTYDRLKIDMAMMPSAVELTNMDKVFWPNDGLTKGDLLIFMREISAYMLPFLKNRTLTLIRSPDGVNEETFFQKHLPSYAPSFINSIGEGTEKLIICDRLESLIWFANHGSVEFHIPFQKVRSEYPNEIVFDLDPPDRKGFPLAIQAATWIKRLIDDLDLISFVKTSGNKGLQIHIPIQEGTMTYEDTAIFTQAIAWTIEKADPSLFTTERMKNKRNGRLYIDYVQHGKDKTLIAPYSPRLTDDATVATPLFWEEVKEGLTPDSFTIKNVVDRVQRLGCPFAGYADAAKMQNMDKMLELVKE
ncbi:DNA ligase D [Virgibacillus byunsanensis]|uniref:DNA ligase D n=1 Tax=Virgibacillus byunsanensis TaxID=570945 RepID=A0ABW3LEX8_9BACI